MGVWQEETCMQPVQRYHYEDGKLIVEDPPIGHCGKHYSGHIESVSGHKFMDMQTLIDHLLECGKLDYGVNHLTHAGELYAAASILKRVLEDL